MKCFGGPISPIDDRIIPTVSAVLRIDDTQGSISQEIKQSMLLTTYFECQLSEMTEYFDVHKGSNTRL